MIPVTAIQLIICNRKVIMPQVKGKKRMRLLRSDFARDIVFFVSLAPFASFSSKLEYTGVTQKENGSLLLASRSVEYPE